MDELCESFRNVVEAKEAKEALAKENRLLAAANTDLSAIISSRDAELVKLKADYEALLAAKQEVDEEVDALEARFTDFLVAQENWRKRQRILEDRLDE